MKKEVDILYTRNIKLKDTGSLVFEKGIKSFLGKALRSGKYTPEELYKMKTTQFLKVLMTDLAQYGLKATEDLSEYDMVAAIKHIKRYIKNWMDIDVYQAGSNTDGFEFVMLERLTPDEVVELWETPGVFKAKGPREVVRKWTKAMVQTLLCATGIDSVIIMLDKLIYTRNPDEIYAYSSTLHYALTSSYGYRYNKYNEALLSYFNKLVELQKWIEGSGLKINARILSLIELIREMDNYEYALHSGCLHSLDKWKENWQLRYFALNNKVKYLQRQEDLMRIQKNTNQYTRGFGFNHVHGSRIKLFQPL